MDIQLDCRCVMSETIRPGDDYRVVSVLLLPGRRKKWRQLSPKLGPSRCEEKLMKLIHKFAEMTPDKRPQDRYLDGTGLRFETMEHGGEYPDTMPQAIKLIDAEGRSCIYVPITQDGKVVDSQGSSFDPEDVI